MKSLMKKLAGLALVLTTSTLLAQPSPDAPATPDVDGSGRVSVTLTVEEMNVRVAELEKESLDATKIVIVLQTQARKDKDVIRLSCINDKLMQLKATQNLFDAAKIAFLAAVGDAQRTHFAVVENEGNNIRRLREEAQACAGEPELQAQQENSFTGPDIPDDPNDPLFDDVLEPPGYASPYD